MAVNVKADLLGDWADNGYALFNDYGSTSMSLYYKGTYIRCFDNDTITKEEVHKECQKHWDRLISQQTY